MRGGIACLFLFLSGCMPYVHSPRVRVLPLETAKALYRGETGVHVEGGGGFGEELGLGALTVRVRHGLMKQLDGSLEGSFQRIRLSGNDFRLENRDVFSARLGLKYAFIDHVAIRGGLGGGGWTGGGFIGLDAALILAFENPYCVPFLDIGGYLSLPVRANTVTLEATAVSREEDFVASPTNTVGWSIGAGLRIPFAQQKHAVTKSALLLGVRFRGAYFDNEPDGYRDGRVYFYGGGGVELVFGSRRGPMPRE